MMLKFFEPLVVFLKTSCLYLMLFPMFVIVGTECRYLVMFDICFIMLENEILHKNLHNYGQFVMVT